MKIDTSKIDGYSEMTAEQKIVALESCEIEVPDIKLIEQELEKHKAATSKANSEAAAYKKQLNERMSETEKAEAERLAAENEREAARKAADDAITAELETLRRENAITKHKARFLGLGYDEALANETAEALASGDMDKVFKNQSTFITNREAAILADKVKNMPVTEHKEPAGKEPYVPPAII